MKNVKTLKDLEVFVGNLLLESEVKNNNNYFYKEFNDFFLNDSQIIYSHYFRKHSFEDKNSIEDRVIKLRNNSIEILKKSDNNHDSLITIHESVNRAYSEPRLGPISFNQVIIPIAFEDGIILSNFRVSVTIKDLQDIVFESMRENKSIKIENISSLDYFMADMHHIETYIFSKKHGFRIYKDGELIKNRKSVHLNRSNFFSLKYQSYNVAYFPKVSEFTSLLTDICNRGTIINGKEDEKVFKEIIENKSIEAKWSDIFHSIDQQYNYWKEDNKVNCANIIECDVSKSDIDKFGYVLFSGEDQSIKYECNCGRINEIDNVEYFVESFQDESTFKRLCEYLNEHSCRSCGSTIDTSEMKLDSNRGYKKSLYSRSLYLVTYKNKPITLPVPTRSYVLGYKYEATENNDLIMRFYGFMLDEYGLTTEPNPMLVSYMKSGKNNKFEYYCTHSSISYPEFINTIGSHNYSGLVIKETPSSVDKLKTEVFPLNPSENQTLFEELGFNKYNVHDLYCETNNINTLRDKYRSMILWEGEFPVVYKTMPMLEALIKTPDYYQIGIDIINNSISSNLLKRHLDIKETKPKNILRLDNNKVNIYKSFIEKYSLPSISYSMIAVLEELETLVDKCSYDIFEAYYMASQQSIRTMPNVNNLIPITRRSVNKINDLNLEIENTGMKVMRYLISVSKNEYTQGILMLPVVAEMYSDYINMLIEVNGENTITDNVLFPQYLEREHDRLSLELVSNLSKLNKEKFNNVITEIKDHLTLEVEDDEYTIVIPENSNDLILEGNTLNHCVGSYVNSVANKRSTIVFVRKKTNKEDPLYTLELRNVHKRESLIRRGQFYGSYNQQPESRAQQFVNKYIQELNEVKLKKVK